MGIARSALSRLNVFRELEKDARLVLSLIYDRRKPRITVLAPAGFRANERLLVHADVDADMLSITLLDVESASLPRLSLAPDVLVVIADSPQALADALRRGRDIVDDAVAVVAGLTIASADVGDFPRVEAECRAFAGAASDLSERLSRALKSPVPVAMPTSESPELAERILAELPEAALLEGARILRVSNGARRELAGRLVEAASELATTIGLSPIPFSDAALLAPLQAAMITSIAFLAGEPLHIRSVGKWAGSLGVAGALAYGFRYGAQNLAKAIPGAGSVISGGVAGAGTLAMGKSATRFYLGEG